MVLCVCPFINLFNADKMAVQRLFLWADRWDHIPLGCCFLSQSASQLSTWAFASGCRMRPCLPPCLLPPRTRLCSHQPGGHIPRRLGKPCPHSLKLFCSSRLFFFSKIKNEIAVISTMVHGASPTKQSPP